MMWSWLLRRLGVLELLTESARAQLAAEERAEQLAAQRDVWRKRAGGNARQISVARDEARQATEWAEAAEERAVEADRERAAALRLAKAHIAVFNLLIEPHFGETCKKVRCHSEELAERFARQVERGTGLPHNSMKSYSCPRCPPQPVTNERWWHVTMSDPNMQGHRKNRIEVRQQWVPRSRARVGSKEQGEALKRRLFDEAG